MKHAPTLADALLRESFKPYWRQLDPNADFRSTLLQARRFVLDDTMSAFMADLAYSALGRFRNEKRDHAFLEHLRTSARLPHKVTWIEFNLRARGQRAREEYGAPVTPALMPDRCGWLCEQHPQIETAFRVTECSSHRLNEMGDLDPAPMSEIVSWVWSTDDTPLPWKAVTSNELRWAMSEKCSSMLTGIATYKSDLVGVSTSHFPMGRIPEDRKMEALIRAMLTEYASDLRYLWALLAAINDLPVSGAHVKPSKGFVARGSYKRFLEHTVITLRIPGNKSMRALAATVNKAARRRAHQVRGHWRRDFRKPGERMWVKEHQRGDASLGFVMHDYEIKHE